MLQIKTKGAYQFVEEGQGQPIVLLHGLFGALSNFNNLFSYFKNNYHITIPLLPIYNSTKEKTSLDGLLEFLEGFMEMKSLQNVVILGNSLGGHLGLKYVLKHQSNVKAMVLTGSSGLYEEGLKDGYPQRDSYEYIKKKTEYTFYDPKVATKELVDEVFDIVSDRGKALSTIYMARSAIKDNLRQNIPEITVPSLLIWGKQDNITPPSVADEFNSLLPNVELHWIDKCGHAPMMEHPEKFNALLEQFLTKRSL